MTLEQTIEKPKCIWKHTYEKIEQKTGKKAINVLMTYGMFYNIRGVIKYGCLKKCNSSKCDGYIPNN
jgi:hypothetical protein